MDPAKLSSTRGQDLDGGSDFPRRRPVRLRRAAPAAPPMKSTRLATVHTFSQYQPDRRIDFNGFLWTRPAGGVLIDPLPLDAAGLEVLAELGGAALILVTNADHWRATTGLAKSLGAVVTAPLWERERLGPNAAQVTHWFERTADLPAALRGHLDLEWVHGGKSAAEPVLDLLAEHAFLFSDIVRSHVSGRLMLLPDAKLTDRVRAVADLKRLSGRSLEAVLLGDGDCLFTGASAEFERFVADLR